MLEKLARGKVVILVCLAYSVLTFLLPYRRVLWNWEGGRPQSTIIFHTASLWVAVVFMIPMVITSAMPESWFARRWDKLLSRSTVILVGYGLLILCLGMAVSETHILWWTWLSFGLLAVMIMLAVVALHDKVRIGEAFIIGVGITSLWRGLWEIPFQAGQKYFYDLPQLPLADVHRMFTNVLVVVAPLVLGGLAILIFYHWRYKLVSLNRWFWVFTGLYVGATVLWFTTGFWIEKVYIWETHLWEMTEANYPALVLYKSSKVWMALALVCLILPKGRLWK